MADPGSLEQAYLPIDRRLALASGVALPSRSSGAVLFVDVAAFTAMTARLTARLGPQRGAEALTALLDAIYTAMVAEIHAYGGSVISFAGDAITCFFAADDDGARALTCGLRLHSAAGSVRAPAGVGPVALKVAVCVGDVRRLSCGAAELQLFDVMIGAPLGSAAAIERGLAAGETGVDLAVAAALGPRLTVLARRSTGEVSFALVGGLASPPAPRPWPALPALSSERTRPWLLRHVREHMSIERGEFLGELRLCTIVFGRLGAAGDDAAMDAAISRVQRVIDRHGGALAQVVLGDKGDYFYAVFGAPVAHEDDASRALAACWELLAEGSRSFGIASGQTYTGAYGSPARRTYGILGPEVNVAARLMTAAPPGTILVSEQVARAAPEFRFAAAGALHLKGFEAPRAALRAIGKARPASAPRPGGRVVGKLKERSRMAGRLEALTRGESGVVVLEGEPGIGKSTLARELVALAEERGVRALIGAAAAIEAATPYYAWRSVLQELLGLLPGATAGSSAAVRAALADPALGPLLPLANAVAALDLAETAATAGLTGERRGNMTRDLVARWIREEMAGRPLLLVIEDVHWMDSASWALALTARFEVAPLLMVLVTRPIPAPQPPPLRQLLADPTCLHVHLTGLEPAEILAMIEARLRVDALPAAAAAWIHERAAGHPFFSQELAFALRDKGLLAIEGRRCWLTQVEGDLRALAFPSTIQGVIASRVDLLAPAAQLTLKVASVVGRVFSGEVLRGVYPSEGDVAALAGHLEAFTALDLTRVAAPAPALRHEFCHAVTHEVVYELLLFVQRARLHRAIARWYEVRSPVEAAGTLALQLAHHWDRAGEPDQALGYLLAAGERSLAEGAYQEAIVALEQALSLEAACVRRAGREEQARRRILLGDALSRVGKQAQARTLLLEGLMLLGAPYPATRGAAAATVARLALRQLARRLWRWGRSADSVERAPRRTGDSAAELVMRAYLPLSVIAYTQNDRIAVLYAGLFRVDRAERAATAAGELARAYAVMVLIAGAARLGALQGEYRRLALAQLEAARGREEATWAMQVLAISALGEGRLAEAEALFERARAESAATGQIRLWEELTAGYAHCLRHRGAWSAADEAFTALFERARRQGDTQAQGWGLANSGYIAARRGDFARARALIDRARSTDGELDAIGESKRLYAAVLIGLRSGDDAAAAAAFAALTPLIAAAPIAYNMLHAHLGASEYQLAALERGGGAEAARAARRWVERLDSYARRFAIGAPYAAMHRARYLAATGGGERAVARALSRALTSARALGLPMNEAEALIGAATLLREVAPTRRREQLLAAQEILRELGAAWELARVAALLEPAGQ